MLNATTGNFVERSVPAITSHGYTEAIQRTYDGGHRVYVVAGRELSSVTSIISRVFGSPFPDGALPYLEHARARGNEVHRCAAILSGLEPGHTLDWETVHHEVAPRVRCFERWRDEHYWTPQYVETAFISLRYGFAGSPDQVGYFSEGSAALDEIADPFTFVLDLKPPSAWFVRLQLIAYAIAVKEAMGLSLLPKRIALYLSDDKPARYPIIDQSARDRDRFLSVLNVFNIGIEEGVWA
jgi:hypothetical protein